MVAIDDNSLKKISLAISVINKWTEKFKEKKECFLAKKKKLINIQRMM